MMKKFIVALCQITPGTDKTENVKHAFEMIAEAADHGAQLIVLPEMFYYPFELQKLKMISGDEHGILRRFKQHARHYAVHICTGSMAVSVDGKLFNTSHLIGPDGEVLLTYSKCHLFDAELDGAMVCESDVFTHGSGISIADTALGKIGVIICYDIRFPEMARQCALSGAELLLVPAVFNRVTGPAHWECFMRTRAVENQLFLVAVSQGGNIPRNGYHAYGHSLVVNPWGDITVEAKESETILYADIDPAELIATRKKLPLLQHRRDRLYTSFR